MERIDYVEPDCRSGFGQIEPADEENPREPSGVFREFMAVFHDPLLSPVMIREIPGKRLESGVVKEKMRERSA